ncbi:hypothetical protein PENTCL1PPCAC_11488, partial [Pristionchus entomophagus]
SPSARTRSRGSNSVRGETLNSSSSYRSGNERSNALALTTRTIVRRTRWDPITLVGGRIYIPIERQMPSHRENSNSYSDPIMMTRPTSVATPMTSVQSTVDDEIIVMDHAGDAKSVPTNKHGDCIVCMRDGTRDPVGCIHCKQCVGCRRCAIRWFKTKKKKPSCPLCRKRWTGIYPHVDKMEYM